MDSSNLQNKQTSEINNLKNLETKVVGSGLESSRTLTLIHQASIQRWAKIRAQSIKNLFNN